MNQMNVHKAGSKNDPSNYRPISVLPVFSKILERGVHKMVYDHLQLNNLLSPSQSDFRPLHSTSTYLTHVTNTLVSYVDFVCTFSDEFYFFLSILCVTLYCQILFLQGSL